MCFIKLHPSDVYMQICKYYILACIFAHVIASYRHMSNICKNALICTNAHINNKLKFSRKQ